MSSRLKAVLIKVMNEIVPFLVFKTHLLFRFFCFYRFKKGIKLIITPFVVIIFLVRQLYLKEIIKVGVEYVSYAIKIV
jgi:hypothetical protein